MSSNQNFLSRVRQRLGFADLVFFVAIAEALTALCLYRSAHRLMWSDELLGYNVLTAPTLRQTLAGWYEGADGGGLFYYLLGRAWMHLFHASAVSLRLFSTSGFVLAIGALWAYARRLYPVAPVACAVALVYLTTPVSVWQVTNGRFYGLFLLSSTAAAIAFLRTTSEERLPTFDLIFIAVSHAALIGSHILGLVYSASFLFTTLLIDLLYKRFRWKLYLAGLAGWVMVPISWHAIIASTSIATNKFWTTVPNWRDASQGYFLYNYHLYHLAIFFAVVIPLMKVMLGAGAWMNVGFPLRSPRLAMYALLVANLMAQLALFFKSRTGISIYSDRYLLPLSAGLVLLFADLFTTVLKGIEARIKINPFVAWGITAMVIAFCIPWGFRADPLAALYPSPGYTARLVDHLPPATPVAVTFLPTFLFLREYDPTHRYVFVLDWDYDLQPQQRNEDHTLQNLMENWRRAGLAPGDILPCPEIFKQSPSFSLITDPSRDFWMRDRLLSSPTVQVSRLSHDESWFPLQTWSLAHYDPAGLCGTKTR